LSGTFIVCCFRAYCLPAVCELPPPVRVGCCSGPEAGATACENISTGSSEEQCSRARDMHTEQSDSKYRHILQQQAPPPAVSCASKPAQAKAHPHTRVGQKSAQTQSDNTRLRCWRMLGTGWRVCYCTIRKLKQGCLTLALAEQGLESCPDAAAMIRSFSSVSGMPNVDAQRFKTSSISCRTQGIHRRREHGGMVVSCHGWLPHCRLALRGSGMVCPLTGL
jgi:hypothetical protein